jgi:hypothetical protein
LAAPLTFGNHCIPLATVLATHLSYTCQNKREPCTETARKLSVLIGMCIRACASFKFDCSHSVNSLIENQLWTGYYYCIRFFCYLKVHYWIPSQRAQCKLFLSWSSNILAYPSTCASVFQLEWPTKISTEP